MKTPFITTTLAILAKDLRAELRGRELVSTMIVFALLSVLIFSFALELDRSLRLEAVGAVLWMTIVFASLLGLNRSMAAERDSGNMDALLIAPIFRAALLCGKLLGNFIFTCAVALLLVVIMTLLYNVNLLRADLLLLLMVGILGFASVGTLLSAMTAQARAREALLPVLMLPMALPIILAVVRSTTGILTAAPLSTWGSYPQIAVAIDVIYLVLCFLLFDFVVEE